VKADIIIGLLAAGVGLLSWQQFDNHQKEQRAATDAFHEQIQKERRERELAPEKIACINLMAEYTTRSKEDSTFVAPWWEKSRCKRILGS
jgi:predicted negative regulator of RcsB-dependent stress response